jgi:uncharacterized membrane protein (UPF0127 family)
MSQHRKSARKTTKNQSALRKIKSSPRQKLITAAVIFFALLFAVSMFFSSTNRSIRRAANPSTIPAPASNSKLAEPPFVKEGEVTFFKADEIVKSIDIEIANTENEIKQGLMFRQKMDEDKGMLFVFPDMQPRGFWMKNTFIPLDIIYVDADKTIVSIQKNTTPLSEQDLPSDGEAQYVIEVNAGFSDRYGLKPGDRVDFRGN